MSDEKTTNLSSITGANLADNDLVMVVDVSDTTMAATGTNKKVTLNEFAQDSTFSSRYAPTSSIGAFASYLSGGAWIGSSISTPNVAALNITSDLDIAVQVDPDNWNSVGRQMLAGNYMGTGYQLEMVGGVMRFFSTTGAADTVSSAAFNYTNGSGPKWLRVTRAVASGTTTFFKSDDGVSWTTVSTHTIAAGSAPSVSTGAFYLGNWTPDNTSGFVGRFYRAIVRNGVGGTVVANWDSRAHTNSAMSVDSATRVWAANTTPVWQSYTPSLSAGSGSFTSASVSAWSYYKNGSFFIAEGVVTITTAGTAAGAIVVTLPPGINWTGYTGTFWVGGWYEGNGGTGGMCLTNSADKVSMLNHSGTTVISDGRSVRAQFSGQVA